MVTHHVSYYPESTVRICAECHFKLSQRKPKEFLYLLKYTRADYKKFYRTRKPKIESEPLRMASIFFDRRDGLHQVVPFSLSLDGCIHFFHLCDMVKRLYKAEFHELTRGIDNPLLFQTDWAFELGEDPYFEDDLDFRKRYGNPHVRFYFSQPSGWGRIEATQPGHYSIYQYFDIPSHRGGILNELMVERIGPDNFAEIRGRLIDIEKGFEGW